jgi:hypothetical protein
MPPVHAHSSGSPGVPAIWTTVSAERTGMLETVPQL